MSECSQTANLAAVAETLAASGRDDLAARVRGIALTVRRIERTLDEIVRDSAEDEAILAALGRRSERAHRRRWHVIQGGAA